ncbi:diaminopimelate decarboxylase [Granulicella arctica]|uniref:Diaminopimelate decarboxylase n=1 Tax=Granulicella arctica TaxID=940613 RepID=A0A7Y9TLI1_9BACT|nr:diaminopimelate decarboxylase [Granulicella arctica]NYF80142.1 diaminopimelate decarboxylase [Granulicella arctica]
MIISHRPFHYRNRRLHCDGVDLTTLAAEQGTPLYVYSAEQIIHRLSLFGEAFAGRAHTVCYSVKANSSLAILRLLAEQGAGFDIVSGGELERVRKASKAALKRIVFSGVGKQVWEIDAALKADILIFNVESEAELALLAERAKLLGKRARFALRVNPDVFADTHPYISTGLREHKFGIDIGLARAIYRKAAKSAWLDPAGVSVHIGSQIRSVEPFAAALKRVLALIGELKQDGMDIRYVDAGGGLGIEYGAGPFDPETQVKGYAAALQRIFSEAGLDPHLLLEPGRFIVAQAGALLTQVLYVKKNGAKTFVITDAGMNDLIRPSLYQAHHEILPVKQSKGAEDVVDVVGPVCESGDFFARDRAMPKVKRGDLVVLLDAGAYGMSLSSNYNTRFRPAEVLVEGDEARLVRRRETMKDLLGPEILT